MRINLPKILFSLAEVFNAKNRECNRKFAFDLGEIISRKSFLSENHEAFTVTGHTIDLSDNEDGYLLTGPDGTEQRLDKITAEARYTFAPSYMRRPSLPVNSNTPSAEK